jgi:hypothetical protein
VAGSATLGTRRTTGWALLARALLVAHLGHQVLAARIVGLLELLPPLGQAFLDLADVGAQAHEVKAGAEAGCATMLNGVLPVRLSKRGCMTQISRMSAASLPRPRHRRCAVEHLVDGVLQRREGARRARRCSQPLTSCHSTQASKKLGATACLRHAAVGVCRAACTKGWSARSTTTSSSG